MPRIGQIKKYKPQSTQRAHRFFFKKTRKMNQLTNFSSSLRPPGPLRFVLLCSLGLKPLGIFNLCVLCDLCG
jgi:hypothetical protein